MPLGASRLNFLAKTQVVVEAEVIRAKVGLSAVGNAQVDTAISKFGGASALFDGNDGINAANPLVPATDNWTVEGWFYPTNIGATDYLWAQYATGQSGRTTGYHTSSGAVGLFINGGPSIGTAAGTMSNNNWYHLAFTRSGSNFAIYVNGVSSATGTGTPSIYQGQPFVIGAQDTVGSNGFIGQIDDVRVSSTVRYTSNFTPPTAPHVNDSDTLLLTHMNGTDGSTDFFDDTGVRAQVGLTAVGSAVNISTAQNKFGGASAHFDASESDQRLYAYDAADGIGTGEFTVETWYRADTFTSVNAIMYMNGRAFYVTSAGRIAYYDGSGFTGTTTMSTNTWYHLVWQRSSNNVIRLFVNGNLETSTTKTTNFGGVMLLGCKNANDQDMDGYLDEFRVSNIARYSTTGFTAPTTPFVNDDNTLMLLHMDGTDGSTTFRDDNGTRAQNGISAVGNAALSATEAKFGGTSLYCASTSNGYGEITDTDEVDLNQYSNWTVEFQIYPTGGGNRILNHAQAGSYNGYYIRMSKVGTDNYMQWISYNGSTNITRQTASGGLDHTQWNHVAFVKNGSNFKIYGNGVEIYTTSSFFQVPGPSTASLLINGSVQSGSPYGSRTVFTGTGHYLDDIRISKIARYTSAFTPPTAAHINDSDTVLLMHMDGTDGSTTFRDDNS